MRILTVCSNLGRGGTPRVAQDFSIAYQRLGHQVAVLSHYEGGVRRARLEAAGIPVVVGSGDADLAAVDSFAPDVIHIHRYGMFNPSEAELMHRLKPSGSKRRIVETNVFARVDFSAAGRLIDVHFQLTRWCMWKWRRWLGGRRHQTAGVVVPNTVDVDAFTACTPGEAADFRARHRIPTGVFLCGRVGQADPSKWHPSTLRAFAGLAAHDREAHLVLLGMPQELQPQLDALSADARARVRVLPLTDSDGELRALYGSLDCFLHASVNGESFGLVLTEAMLCGAPVVTASRPHKDNSQVDVVRHRVDGLVAASTDALDEALKTMHGDASLRQRLRETAASGVIQRFAAQTVAATAIRVMEHALAHGDQKQLLNALQTDGTLVTDTDDAYAMARLRDSIGEPNPRELRRMRLLHHPLVHRGVQLYLQATLYRRLRKQFQREAAARRSAGAST
jgi:glycosyltransferase involved in cell wall biosynthesis